MEIKPIIELDDDVDTLIQMSRDYQAEIYPAESINQDDPEYLVKGGMYFVGAYDGERLCGIGGVKIMRDTPDYGEIKNLFVDPACRGLGISRMVMQALETHLIKNKTGLCRLETGVSQPESVGLYHSLGYRSCDAYGSYQPDPLSIFMEKEIK